ncbi:MAG: TRAP transporter substrate-binding protein [Rhodospirillales bacterium]
MSTFIKTTTAAIVGLSVASFAVSAQAQTKWDMPVAYAAGNFHTQTAVAFADAVKTATGGKLVITVHPSGSLFKGNEIKRAVQTGQAPIGERLLSAHENENPMFGVDSIPFLATSFADASKLWTAAKPELAKLMDEQNLVLLYSVPWPPQGFYFNKEVNSVADAKGVKFRSYSTATARIAALMGMAPVQVEAAEISQAFATGVAESMISSGSTGYDRKIWEHVSHFYEVNAWLPRNYIFANKDAWNALDEDTRNIVKGVAELAERSGTLESEKLTDWYKGELKANGMTVAVAGDKLKGELQQIGETMAAEWLEKAGASGKAVVDAYKKM